MVIVVMVVAVIVIIVIGKKCERKHSSLNHYNSSNMENLLTTRKILLLPPFLGELRPREVKVLAQGHTMRKGQETGVDSNQFVYSSSCLRLSNHVCHSVVKTPTIMTQLGNGYSIKYS